MWVNGSQEKLDGRIIGKISASTAERRFVVPVVETDASHEHIELPWFIDVTHGNGKIR